MTPTLRKKRVWSVADFALHAYGQAEDADCLRARRLLMRLHAKHKGKLFMERGGPNCAYTFAPATLARLEPDLFEPIESLEVKVDALEDEVGELREYQRRTIMQVGANTRRGEKHTQRLDVHEREIAKLKTRKVA